ncbi:guanine nucleotide-binding protein-like 1 isoform X1 [Haliotis rufescens]|uniref:guanine nucleotide-binding protein-like 1 isoform X1 n=1 Tax=Haliotis rufescens TaxID=6454 RepID=UPI00201EA4A9|nr:guanine nucleotide-binding protein-like 1 isoform X1 [Haliotis rufescens]
MPRKVAFSVKQKKKQLQERRQRKQARSNADNDTDSDSGDVQGERAVEGSAGSAITVNKINQQPSDVPDRRLDPNRFRLHFFKMSDKELEKKREECLRFLTSLPENALETDIDDIYKPGTVLDLPKRPAWTSATSKQVLEQREDEYFQRYLDNIFAVYGPRELSYFEMNLETWRQLWRVTEMSDIMLLVTDIRHPALHFSPALYDHVTRDLNKPMILVLNKVDLAPLGLVVAWKDYFHKHFPKLRIVFFTSYAEASSHQGSLQHSKCLNKGHKTGRRIKSVGSRELLEACENLVEGKAVDLSSWRSKVECQEVGKDEDADVDTSEAPTSAAETLTDDSGHVRYRDGVLTIGCVGYPNVGKSSLINGLVGKKVVSVSKTPGHTKHFQTIFLTPTVKLCDCPGLVFPSLIEKPLQVLSGIFPVAHVRDPYSCIAYLASRINLTLILKLTHPKADRLNGKDLKWTAYDICNEWAVKCGYNTARGARPDIYRAANHILRMTVEGRLRLNFTPPGYTESKEAWRDHPEVIVLLRKGQSVIRGYRREVDTLLSSDTDEEEVMSSAASANQRPEEAETLDVSNPFSTLSGD